ncbi:MAG: FAD-binding oxidoreductase [Thaumarchaeota archaeon]|nr:FAD-binding oxidoreductase [Nitrososphaerota archaeon]
MSAKYQNLIVGGGIAGLSIAYEMSRLGEKQICLVDECISEVRHRTSSALKLNSTAHSAGIITSQL